MIRIEVRANKLTGIDITVEESFMFFFKKIRKYAPIRKICVGHWTWVQIPNRELVKYSLGIELDYAYRDFLREKS